MTLEDSMRTFQESELKRRTIMERAEALLGDAFDYEVLNEQFRNYGEHEFSEMLNNLERGIADEEEDSRKQAMRESFATTLRLKLEETREEK